MSKLKADLHTHTSEDPRDIIKYNAYCLIDKAARLGFDVLAITNHNLVTYNKKLVKYAEKKDILLIPGMEATLSGKHVLILNPDFIKNPKGRSIRDLPKLKSYKNLIIAPHPFFPQSKSLKSLFYAYAPHFDALEFSHCYNNMVNFNKKTIQVSEQQNLPLIGTSDCHFLWEFGSTFSLIDSKKDPQSIIEAVKNGKIEVCSTPLPLLSMLRIAYKYFQLKLLITINRRVGKESGKKNQVN